MLKRMPLRKIVVTGAAGLVGQNLIPLLKANRHNQADPDEIIAIDKHPQNTAILRSLHPDIRILDADLAMPGPWQRELEGCTHLVLLHAQIGGKYAEEYVRNNITASEIVVETAVRYNVGYTVNISSSVVNSMAVDNYTETKKAQETLTVASGLKQVVLRPTLMFGWFDRKHVGWLARFMQRVPVFPIPGDGKFLRQPLFGGDFSAIIASALSTEITGTYNISGQQRIDYIDLIRAVKIATGAKARILKIPYTLFAILLKTNALWDKNPPFTVKQLEALVTPDLFEVIDWPAIFNVRSTPLQEALDITFRDPTYSQVTLEF
jgi:nucleoside-diphosphate-sugar epimerase